MIRRAAWRAVGLTELPAAQRKRGRLHGRTAPFEAARRPRPGKWSPPAARHRHKSAEIVSSTNPINIRMDSAAASTRAQNVRAATPISSEGAMLSER